MQSLRLREHMGQRGMNLKGLRHLAAVQLNELARELTRGGHADLLAEHCTDGDLESIPSSGRTQAGPLCNQPGECWVCGKMTIDDLDICSEIEQLTHACDDARKGSETGKQDGNLNALLFGKMSHGDASR